MNSEFQNAFYTRGTCPVQIVRVNALNVSLRIFYGIKFTLTTLWLIALVFYFPTDACSTQFLPKINPLSSDNSNVYRTSTTSEVEAVINKKDAHMKQ